MKLSDIVKTVGSAALQVALPGTGSLIVHAVNELLPEEQRLPVDATGAQVERAVNSLPPADRAEVMSREFEVELTQIKQSHETARMMLEVEARSTQTTRPYIAKGSFQLVAAVSLIVIALWSYAVGVGNVEMVKTVMGGWEFIGAVLFPFVLLLWAYFGIIKQEHRNRLDAVTGASRNGISGLIQSILKK